MTTLTMTGPAGRQRGALMVLVLVFGAIFLTIVTSLITSVITQSQVVAFRAEQQRATEIAEAGLNYYKWFLAHHPASTTGDGTTTVFEDPVTGPIGEYSLAISSSSYCGVVSSLTVESTAHTYVNPAAIATVSATYKRPTVAEYSFITNAGVWYGPGSVVNGPLHSNQGLRMEAAHNSLVGSGQVSWTCDSSYGCNPTVNNAPGVYSSGSVSTPGLFQYPVSPIDFAGLTLDLSSMKDNAENNGGIYYPPTSEAGYEVIFNGDDTVTINEVTGTIAYTVSNNTEGQHTERNIIDTRTPLATRSISNDCPVLYFEDKVWLSGEVNQKVALAAADLAETSQTNLVINGNITYAPGANAGLLAIAEDDIDYGIDIPENLFVNGIYVAQNGRVGRNFVRNSWLPGTTYDSKTRIDSITFLGTIVTNGRAGSTWVNGSGDITSGFINRTSSFDRDQVDDPPPLTPETSDVYELQDWRQAG
jgi:Tfp pilus assembly protein PilX